jgi:uncharacterized Tic20 family protein
MHGLAATPPTVLPLPRGTDKIWAILSHLSTFLGIGFLLIPLVVYLAMKDESPYVRENAREALNFHLSVLLYGLCCVPLVLALGLGLVLALALYGLLLICSLVAALKASNNGCYRYPLTLRMVG